MASPAFFGIGTGRSPSLPTNVQVRYQVRRCIGPLTDTTLPTWWLSTVPLSSLTLPIPAVDQGNPVGRGTLVLKDTALAMFSVGSMAPSNQITLNALTQQIAQDYVNFRSMEFDQTYNGILAITPSGNAILDLIEWSMTTSQVQTRIFTSPWNSTAEEFQHNDPANINCQASGNMGIPVSQAPCVAAYGPLAFCASGGLRIPVYNICLEDGRLFQTYQRTDVISASG